MPIFGAVQTPTSLAQGESVRVLAPTEALASGGITMAVAVNPQPFAVCLGIHNNTTQSITLVASPDLVQADFLPVTSDTGVALTIAAGKALVASIAPGLYYAVQAAAAISGGTIWLSR